MTDCELRQHILDEFEFDPSFNSGHIEVTVRDNAVTLTGHVSNYAEKLAAIAATRRVKGVHALAEQIEVRYRFDRTADDQIAQRASDILDWDVLVPANAVEVQVKDGWITLTGSVDWHYERTAAEDDVRKLAGVQGVTNLIVINNPHVDTSSIRDRIEFGLEASCRDRIETDPRHRSERQQGGAGRQRRYLGRASRRSERGVVDARRRIGR